MLIIGMWMGYIGNFNFIAWKMSELVERDFQISISENDFVPLSEKLKTRVSYSCTWMERWPWKFEVSKSQNAKVVKFQTGFQTRPVQKIQNFIIEMDSKGSYTFMFQISDELNQY